VGAGTGGGVSRLRGSPAGAGHWDFAQYAWV